MAITEADRKEIELLIVATESGVDDEKALSTWVHRYLRLTPHCRNFEIKHACYGGTAGLQMAVNWVASGIARGAKALVIAADESRMHLGRPWEFVLGAGAAAVLVSDTPQIVEVELGKSGYWTQEISDLTRPTSRVETGNSETSLLSYVDALEGAYAHYLERVDPLLDFDTFFSKNIYHAPFGGMTFRAHRTLLRHWKSITKREAWEHFERKTLPSLKYLRRMGGTYAASTFIGLLGLLEDATDLVAGDRVSIFSYGSGSCAEFYSALVCPEARQRAKEARLTELLDVRRRLSVEEYEAVERERSSYIDVGCYAPELDVLGGWYERHYRGKGLLEFRGMRDYYRQYGWS
jgi:hydroxymethylglutaryl-CoA synthase